MTAFPSRLILFRTLASLGPLLLIWLLLPTEAASQTRAAVDQQRTAEVPNPHGSNPIAPSEKDRTKQAAEASAQVKSDRARVAGLPRQQGLIRPADVQLLYTERCTPDKNADPQTREGCAVYYNYPENKVVKVTVNLRNNTVRAAQAVNGGRNNQPFPASVETSTALKLALKDPEVGAYLRKAYNGITGGILTDASQLEAWAQGGIYVPDSSPLSTVAANCRRCLRMFLTDPNGTNFIGTDHFVVDLSKEQVLIGGEPPTGQAPHTH